MLPSRCRIGKGTKPTGRDRRFAGNVGLPRGKAERVGAEGAALLRRHTSLNSPSTAAATLLRPLPNLHIPRTRYLTAAAAIVWASSDRSCYRNLQMIRKDAQ